MTNEEAMNSKGVKKLLDQGYVTIVCRLCGQPWLYPPQYADQFDSGHPLECIYCVKNGRLRRLLGDE